MFNSAAEEPQHPVVERHAGQRRQGARPVAPPQRQAAHHQHHKQHGKGSHIGIYDRDGTCAPPHSHRHLLAGMIAPRLRSVDLHNLLLRLGQTACGPRLAAAARRMRGDSYQDRIPFDALDHPAMFNQLRHSSNRRTCWSAASAARVRTNTSKGAARAGTGSVSSRCA